MAQTLIKTQNPSGASNITFIDGTSDVVFDGTYPMYICQYTLQPDAGNDAVLRLVRTKDGGTNWENVTTVTAGWSFGTAESGSTSGPSFNSDYSHHNVGTIFIGQSGTNDGENCSGLIYMFTPENTTYVKHFNTWQTTGNGSDAHKYYLFGGYHNETSAIDGFKLQFDSQNATGIVKLYGVS